MPDTRNALAVTLVAVTIAGCQTLPREADTASAPRVAPPSPPSSADAERREAPPRPQDTARIFKGTGVVVRGQQPGGGVPGSSVVRQPGGAVVLNFEGADLREVVRNILGEILNEAYTIDAGVGGQVTIRTSAGIPREALHATLETILRSNGATMVKEANIWRIVPQANAVRGNVTPQLGSSTRALPPGYSVQIVPLRYVGVRDMMRILEPFQKDAQAVRADDLRNLIILSGTERELKHLMDTIDMFDIDWMAGMSAGVFVLQNAEVKIVMAELERLIGPAQQSPLAGIVRIVPIERMNAILVVTPNPQYLEDAKKWIERLDQSGAGDSPRLYVYALQNSRAEKVAPLLQQAFTGRVTQQFTTPAPTVAPGTPAGSIVSPPTFAPTPLLGAPPPPTPTPTPPKPVPPVPGAAGAAAGPGIVRNLQAVADKDNNTIIIVATPGEYAIIESALRKLDTPARQVAIEMTIAEVALNDTLQFGVEWLFTDAPRGSGGLVRTPIAGLPPPEANAGFASPTGIANTLSRGFTYLLSSKYFPGGIQAALRLLDTYGNTKVISNPHVAALDNQKATVKVGNRIPICQQTIVGNVTNAVTTTSQYIDTGVLLQVTPHINAGGLVTLDVQAEVSTPGTTTRECEAPPINTRSVQTFLAVPSGETMVMGGLILDNNALSSAGLPLLSRIPVIGALFGEQNVNKNRTELVLFVTPKVMENEYDVRGVIDDLRRRMERLDQAYPPARPGGPPQPPRSPPAIVAPG
ncbi:MAG TPA: type II secretion system secretin GspD [Casimicrobiaceae bacterium]|nr:type II secretion system secretin GspD [Casimicrobiaceae bacterium]